MKGNITRMKKVDYKHQLEELKIEKEKLIIEYRKLVDTNDFINNLIVTSNYNNDMLVKIYNKCKYDDDLLYLLDGSDK